MTEVTVKKFDARRLVAILSIVVFFLASFRAPGVTGTALTYSVPGPIATIQNISLGIIGGFLLLIIIIYFLNKKDFPTTKISIGAIYYLIFTQILSFTEFFYTQQFPAFAADFTFHCVIFYFFTTIISSYKFSTDKYNFLNISFYGTLGFLTLNVMLYFLNIGVISWKGRFFGLTGQPNFIGMCGGVLTLISFLLLFDIKTTKQKMVYAFGFLIGICIIYLSQSRSSLLSAIAGCLFIMFVSFKNQVIRLFIVFVAVMMVIFLAFNMDLINDLNYTDRGNTRELTWKILETKALTFPILGYGTSAIPTSNSYLFAFVAAGLVGSIFLYLSIFKIFQRAFSIFIGGVSRYPTATLAYGSFLLYFLVAALFEGLLLDSVSIPVFVFWGILAYGK